jgi:hypothetical protein
MPAKRVDEYCDEATGSREAVDSKIYPIPPEQRSAAKDADNQKTQQEATMQVGPEHHEHGQQETSRSFQAFGVEDRAKQHGRSVWRGGEINIRGRGEGGIEQTRGKNRNANCNRRGSAAQADGGEISDYDCAGRDHE